MAPFMRSWPSFGKLYTSTYTWKQPALAYECFDISVWVDRFHGPIWDTTHPVILHIKIRNYITGWMHYTNRCTWLCNYIHVRGAVHLEYGSTNLIDIKWKNVEPVTSHSQSFLHGTLATMRDALWILFICVPSVAMIWYAKMHISTVFSAAIKASKWIAREKFLGLS